MKSGVTLVIDKSQAVTKAIRGLASQRVMVGFPADGAGRKGDQPLGPDRRDMDASGINNATLGYIHNYGSPEANIPERNFMESGIKKVQGDIVNRLRITGQRAFRGDPEGVKRGFNETGLVAQRGVRSRFSEGIPPPLADSTLQARLRARPGRKAEKAELAARAAGAAPSTDLVKPLVDTAQMRNAISYIIRKVTRKRA